jgi:hypothetical protein
MKISIRMTMSILGGLALLCSLPASAASVLATLYHGRPVLLSSDGTQQELTFPLGGESATECKLRFINPLTVSEAARER